MPPKGTSSFTEEEITSGLMAVIAWAGNAHAASRYLKAEKGLSISPATLYSWKTTHVVRYDELRDKYAGQLEANLANEMRDVARLAMDVQRVALEKTKVRLDAGEDNDPARSAANAATVAQKMTDKLLSLTGRPTQITETRNLDEILRSLAARKIIQIPEEAVTQAESVNGSE